MQKNSKKEVFNYQAEVSQLLNIVTNSLYSNKEIFLRELISNAFDAIEKVRFLSMTDNNLNITNKDYKIYVDFDIKKETITIKDNGIGMSKEEVIKNLGTIAKSGTKEFFNALTGNKEKDSALIGQFGVGFYSSFVVASKVVVVTRKVGEDKLNAVIWSSKGDGKFSIEDISKNEYGTEVILYLKKDELNLLNSWKLRSIINKYADYINIPILMKKTLSPDDEEKQKKGEIIIPEEEVINKTQAIWVRQKSEIKNEEYEEFYKNITHDFEKPLCWEHYKIEGKLEYKSILFVPKKAPFDLWQPNKSRGLKLYIQKVFIMNDADQFLPHYLRFVKGIVDSNDLPLNISREILQNNKIINIMKTSITRRVLSILENIYDKDKKKYYEFWKEFGQVLKEGIAEDSNNKDRLSKIYLFSSSIHNDKDQKVSLKDYISRMGKKQNKIYYITSETFNSAQNSPNLEVFRKNNIEVILLYERIDEWLVTHLTEFEGKKLQSVSKGILDLQELDIKDQKETNKKENKEDKDILIDISDMLKDKVKKVRYTSRLSNYPSCIVYDENDMSPQMEKIMRATGQKISLSKPILELNPNHLFIDILKKEKSTDKKILLSNLLLEQAILAEGGQLDNPSEFIFKLNSFLSGLLSNKDKTDAN
jgi:molecular chaperone HtpG